MKRGIRYAPSPTGILHVGNLRTAWISQRLAQALGESWIVRFDDIDTPRVIAGAKQQQEQDFRALGLIADEVIVQSQRHPRHSELFHIARTAGLIYPCDCSRKDVARQTQELASFASAPHAALPPYSGRCRHRDGEPLANFLTQDSLAWRWKMQSDATGRHDPIVLRTRDSATLEVLPGYHWACAIDDADGDYRLLVRAWDLAESELIQKPLRLWVRSLRGEAVSAGDSLVFHTSLVVQADGKRLEKRTQGITLKELTAQGILPTALVGIFARSFREADALIAIEKTERGETSSLLGEPIRHLELPELLRM